MMFALWRITTTIAADINVNATKHPRYIIVQSFLIGYLNPSNKYNRLIKPHASKHNVININPVPTQQVIIEANETYLKQKNIIAKIIMLIKNNHGENAITIPQ